MTDPVTINCPSACAVTLQVEITTPFFSLSEAEGALIAGAILAVWAFGWGIRAVIRTVNSSDGNTTLESES